MQGNATQRNVRVPTEKLVQVQNTASATYATVAGICSAILDANRVEKRGTATMNACIMAASMPSWCASAHMLFVPALHALVPLCPCALVALCALVPLYLCTRLVS